MTITFYPRWMHMTPDDSQEVPVDTEAETETKGAMGHDEPAEETDADIQAAKEAWDSDDDAVSEASTLSDEAEDQLSDLAQPFVGQWNNLISTTNWEKGRIISEWREALIETGVDATQYSDEAWARRVGGVTAPHVGRLRRVYDRFGSTFKTYDDVYWSHFLAALDWDDAPMWLEGASKENWSVSGMREKRWQENGAVESQRPTNSEIVEVDLDEDITLPAEGGGRTKEYDGDSSGVASGPLYEEPDFGDEEELTAVSKPTDEISKDDDAPVAVVQPFVGLPELPDDVSDAIETLKLCVLRHKTDGWRDTNVDDIQKYLDAIGLMIRA